jgi:hypothetical protein
MTSMATLKTRASTSWLEAKAGRWPSSSNESSVKQLGSGDDQVSQGGVFENARPKEQLANKDCRLTTAALLVGVATVNGEMSQAGERKLHAVLKSSFGLNYLTTSKLIHGAATAERSAIDLCHFTSYEL